MFILDSAFSGVVSAFIQDELLIQYLNRLGILSERADHDLSEVLLPVIGFIQIKYIFCSHSLSSSPFRGRILKYSVISCLIGFKLKRL